MKRGFAAFNPPSAGLGSQREICGGIPVFEIEMDEIHRCRIAMSKLPDFEGLAMFAKVAE
jgi:hypothetical protein